MIRTLSMGAGVQTTALLLMDPKRYDYVIFADTGDEKEETYYYIDKYLKPFCKENDVPWITVKHNKGFSLMEWCMKRKILPIRTRRWCTMDFKVKPINRFIRTLGATMKNPVICTIGISYDEAVRAHLSKYDVKYVVKEFPLIEQKITRNMCYKIIEEKGYPIPPKSGCDYCMFNKRSHFRELYKKHPERFKKIVEMEKNDYKYPMNPLVGKFPLEGIMLNGSLDNYMDEKEDETCESGYCFT